MNDTKRKTIRAAVLIRDLLVQTTTEGPKLDGTDSAWQACRRLAEQITKAGERGWHFAARRLREQLAYAVSSAGRYVEELSHQLDPVGRPPQVPSERELYEDILALEQEFDEVDLALKVKTLSVTTDSIILEGVDLGRFEIVLAWRSWRNWEAYAVNALDPNPAASDSETTHPHVQSNDLCEGEGKAPIRRALHEGRLVDFFVLVRQILQTYNPSSAYVSLENWSSVSCNDCGGSVPEDACDRCDRCETDLCAECTTYCQKCSRWFCSVCIGACSGCGESFCEACLNRCDRCGQLICEECLSDDQCPKCRKAAEEESPAEQEAAPAAA